MPSRSHPVRPLVPLLAGLLATLLLAGCSGDSDRTSLAADGPTRTVTDVEGTSMQVPVHPERVVTLSEPTLDGALALGVTPVGTTSGRGQSTAPHYLADLAGDIPLVAAIAQPNLEEIAELGPDLILVDGTSVNNNDQLVAKLRRIAPTYYAGYAGGDWRDNFTQTATALNLEQEGQQVLDEYDARVSEVAGELSGYADQTFSIVRWQGGSPSMILKELPAGIALTDLGLRRPAAQDKRGRGHSEPVSLENLTLTDADYMFFGTLGGSSVENTDAGGDSDVAAAEEALADAMEVPGFGGLDAVREDHVIPVDGSLWTSTGGPLLMTRIVDSVEEALA